MTKSTTKPRKAAAAKPRARAKTKPPVRADAPDTTTYSVPLLDQFGPDHPLGITEVGAVLGVKRQTVDVWRHRQEFPRPEPTRVGGRPWWRWGAIRQWAIDTGRLLLTPEGDVPPVTIPAPRGRKPLSSTAEGKAILADRALAASGATS